jgi:hypothetical protein
MNVRRGLDPIHIQATHFRSWAKLAGELKLPLDRLAELCVFADLHLGAWRGQWIGLELCDQLDVPFPSQRQPRIGLTRRAINESAYIGALTDNEGLGDFNTLFAHELASSILDRVAERELRAIVLVAPAAPARWGHDNVLLVDLLAQACAQIGCTLLMVFGGDDASGGESPRWRLEWLDASEPTAPRGSGTSAIAALPGVIPASFAASCSLAPSEALPLPGGRLLLSPLQRKHPDTRARELLVEFLEGEGSLEYQWLAAYAFADDLQDDDEVGVLFASASHRSAEGGEDVVLRLLEIGKSKTTDVSLRAWADAQRANALVRLRRWDEAAAGPLPADELDPSVKVLLLQGRAWGLVMTNRAAEAELYFQATRDLMGDRRDSKYYLYLLNTSALNKLRIGAFDEALELEKTIERALAAEQPYDWHAAYINNINQARLYKKARDLPTWEAYYQRAFAITDGVRSESDLLYTPFCFAQLAEKKGLHKEAVACWLRSALHWLSGAVPEALAPRMVEAVLLGPQVDFVDKVSQRMIEYLRAAWVAAGYDAGALDVQGAAVPSFARADAAGVATPRVAIGGPGWGICLAGEATSLRWNGADYANLSRTVWAALRSLAGDADLPASCAVVTDAQYGSDLPCTRDELIDSAARLGIPSVYFAGERVELDEASGQARRKRADVGLAPCVARLGQGAREEVIFKRYRAPLPLSPAQAKIVRAAEAGTTIEALLAGAATLAEIDALEAARVLRVRTRG